MAGSIFCDWRVNRGNRKGQWVLLFFRVAAAVRGLPEPWWWAGVPVLALYRVGVEWVLGIELRYKTRVGPRLRLFHGQGLVVHEGTVIGADCVLRHGTTLGNKSAADGATGGCPVLEDGVEVGANAVVLGPVRVGKGR